MKSKELFTIKFGTANKSGAGFLLEEINTILLLCTGRLLQEEFQLIANMCHKQIKEKKAMTCIADFALMDTDVVEDYIKNDFYENISTIYAPLLAIVLPQKVQHGQLVHNTWQIPKEHALTTLYTDSLSDALHWITTQDKLIGERGSNKIHQGKIKIKDFIYHKMANI